MGSDKGIGSIQGYFNQYSDQNPFDPKIITSNKIPVNQTLVEKLRELHDKHENLDKQGKFNWDDYIEELNKIPRVE